jgi:hypothetical protein
MRSPLTLIRHAAAALVLAGALGFGATQALASPQVAPPQTCPVPQDGSPTYWYQCGQGCIGNIGYCNEYGICKCGYIP